MLYKKNFWIAIIFTFIASILGQVLSKLPLLNIIGAMVIALLIGMIFQLIPNINKLIKKDVGYISSKFLRIGIILLGFKLNLIELAEFGIKTILLSVVVVIFTITLIYIISKKCNVEDELALLTASGCGICGAAAVMGVSPQVKAKTDDCVLAIAVVCILGTIFTFIQILLKPYLFLTSTQLGIVNGASLHEIAHVVAAAGASGENTLKIAIIMKLSRVLMLAPVAFLIGIFYQYKHKNIKSKAKLPIPWFMLGFIFTSIIGTIFSKFYGNQMDLFIHHLTNLAYILLGMAMTALGVSVNFRVIKDKGGKIFLIASIVSTLLFGLTYICAKFLFI